MLENGRERLTDTGIGGNVRYVQADSVCHLPIIIADIITIAFGFLRNVTDKDAALRSMLHRVKTGWTFISLGIF